MELVRQLIERMMAPLHRRVMLMVGRAVLTAIDDAPEIQRVQITALKDEAHNGVRRFQHYGFTSRPLPGALAVVLFQAGNRDHGAVIAEEIAGVRPRNLLPGEVEFYDHLGKFIKFGADGTLTIHAPRIVIEADEDLRLYAGDSYRWDVGGYAVEVEAAGGGEWVQTGWSIGASVTAETVAVEPPRVGDP